MSRSFHRPENALRCLSFPGFWAWPSALHVWHDSSSSSFSSRSIFVLWNIIERTDYRPASPPGTGCWVLGVLLFSLHFHYDHLNLWYEVLKCLGSRMLLFMVDEISPIFENSELGNLHHLPQNRGMSRVEFMKHHCPEAPPMAGWRPSVFLHVKPNWPNKSPCCHSPRNQVLSGFEPELDFP